MKFTNRYTLNFSYSIFYALLVSSIAILFDQCSILLKTENSIYDPLQKLFATGQAEDWRVARFQKEFDKPW